MLDYIYETKRAMNYLGEQPDTVFLGQTVCDDGSPMYRSLINVPISKKIEMPVAEEMQMGISIGMALDGYIPVSVYPRIDFLLCAINELVNHLDKIPEMSNGEFRPGVIIRTQIGNTKPLYPGIQHCGNHYQALKLLCPNMRVIKLSDANAVKQTYRQAYRFAKEGISSIIIETPQGGKNPNKK